MRVPHHIEYADGLMFGSDDYAMRRVGWESYVNIIEKYRTIAGRQATVLHQDRQ
jgi:hypothetical protein